MADKKVDATTGEVQVGDIISEQVAKVEKDPDLRRIIEHTPITPMMDSKPVLKVHCKPVFNYQSVEFDWDVQEDSGFDELERIYSVMLQMLVRVSQNAPQVEAKKPVAPVEEPATEAQKQILRNFHIDFKPDITKKQAHNLIKKSMDQEVF